MPLVSAEGGNAQPLCCAALCLAWCFPHGESGMAPWLYGAWFPFALGKLQKQIWGLRTWLCQTAGFCCGNGIPAQLCKGLERGGQEDLELGVPTAGAARGCAG